MKQWPEFCVKNVWHLVRSDARLCRYLPSEKMNKDKYPDRAFFWGITFTVVPIWANQYTKLVMKKRYAQAPHDFDKTKQIVISENWI